MPDSSAMKMILGIGRKVVSSLRESHARERERIQKENSGQSAQEMQKKYQSDLKINQMLKKSKLK